MNHIRDLIKQEDGSLDEEELVHLASHSLKGQEIDKEVCEVANATLAARLSIFDRPCVANGDSLQLDFQHPSIESGSHLCAATNPPFGTKITIKDNNLLRRYELAAMGDRVSNRAPDVLFIERNTRLLKPGEGRLAIVVPYQVLSGPQTLFVRAWILRQAHVLAVVDLPADTFQPHTGTKGALLILKRRTEPLKSLADVENTEMFMSMPRWIGHDRRGNPVYQRNPDGSPGDEILTDFHDVEQAFDAFLQGQSPSTVHPHSFVTHISAILADPERRMNALFHRPSKEGHDADHSTQKRSKDWRVERLGDVVARIFCPTRFKRGYVDFYPGAVPFLGGSNISQLTITTNKWLRHDDPKLDELRVKANWILITRSGSTGIVSIVPRAWDGFAMSEHVIRIVPDTDKLDPAYIYSFLKTQYAQDILARGVFGSVIDEINPEFVGLIQMPVPKSEEVFQSLVAKTSRALEARNQAIELLAESENEINSRLLDRL